MVLITGSSGFIGSHLIEAFPGAIGLDKVDNGRQMQFIHCDLLDKVSLFWMLRAYDIKVVLHMAAVPSVPDSYSNPMRTYSNNVTGSLNLIDVCLKLGVQKFIFASSSSVLGPSPYGHSKKFIEDMLPHSGLKYSTLRFFNVFGNRQRSNLVRILIDKLNRNEEIIINGDSSISRDFSHVSNVVQACRKSISHDYDGKILEVGTGRSYSIMDLYNLLKKEINPTHNKLTIGPDRIGDIKYSRANTFLDADEITHLEEGLKLCNLEALPLVSAESGLLGDLSNGGSQNTPNTH